MRAEEAKNGAVIDPRNPQSAKLILIFGTRPEPVILVQNLGRGCPDNPGFELRSMIVRELILLKNQSAGRKTNSFLEKSSTLRFSCPIELGMVVNRLPDVLREVRRGRDAMDSGKLPMKLHSSNRNVSSWGQDPELKKLWGNSCLIIELLEMEKY
jgi:hypothetical protein